jgi:1,4-dihydroxy-2-naphthoate octaprenyltransferase
VLSGGSKVIQQGLIPPEIMWSLGKWLAVSFIVMAGLFAAMGRYDLTIFILVGTWAATSYSVSPLRFSYRPFLGEWLSLFPALFVLGIAGPWFVLETIPIWAIQNSLINTFICMSWVMVHHIPDIEADRQATPKKLTTVVWFSEQFGLRFTRMPALLYLTFAALCTIWVGFERIAASVIVLALILYAMYLVVAIQPKNVQQITKHEKCLLLLALLIAVSLGVLMV